MAENRKHSNENDFQMKISSNSRKAGGRSQEQCSSGEFRNLSRDND